MIKVGFFVLDVSGNSSSFSPFDRMLAAGMSFVALIVWRQVSSVPKLLKVFIYFLIMKGCYISSSAFFASIEILRWLLFFNLLCVMRIDLVEFGRVLSLLILLTNWRRILKDEILSFVTKWMHCRPLLVK